MEEIEFEVILEDKESFYDTYKSWCSKRDFPAIPLRQIDTVFVCYKESFAVYSCFFWKTNSTFAVIGFPMGNPFVDKEYREGGLDFLFSEISCLATLSGYEILWTTSNTEPVIESMLKTGFKVADTNVDQYYKRLF